MRVMNKYIERVCFGEIRIKSRIPITFELDEIGPFVGGLFVMSLYSATLINLRNKVFGLLL